MCVVDVICHILTFLLHICYDSVYAAIKDSLPITVESANVKDSDADWEYL